MSALSAGNNAVVRFTITKGTPCIMGYNIWHSTDSINFNVIYNAPGQCGDGNSDMQYSYTHANPQPQNTYHYYKVEIIGLETSAPLKVFVGNAGYGRLKVYPNPITHISDYLTPVFPNAPGNVLTGYIYNPIGYSIKSFEIDNAQNQTVQIPVYDLNQGEYILWMTDGQQVFQCKFIVNRSD
ncbi:MAG: hypothetical protein JSU07_12890 [Bacteroidetes bacterium]|nr:hypothetical protein [Bacteroidota bacterium]